MSINVSESFLLYPFKATPVPIFRGGERNLWGNNATIETSHHFDMCFGPLAIGALIQTAPTQSSLQFTWPLPLSEVPASDSPAMSLFVFGNGFQVTIAVYVTWWLMGKIHLRRMPTSESHPCKPSRMSTVECVPSPDSMTHVQLDARFFKHFFTEVNLCEDKVQSVRRWE